MKITKRKRLEAAGWKVGSAKGFLGLTPEEAAERLRESPERHYRLEAAPG